MPPQLWTVEMVLEFLGSHFLAAWAELHLFHANCQLEIVSPSSGPDPIWNQTLAHAPARLTAMASACDDAQMPVSAAVIRNVLNRLDYFNRPESLVACISAIRASIETELTIHRFARIPQGKVDYFEQPALFGSTVASVFPLAERDIRQAGTCYAIGMDTASVFHSMRAAEYGLRHIAKSLGIEKLSGKKPVPVEYATWNKAAEAIDSKLDALHKLSPGAARARKLNHFSEMNAHIFVFRDAWRDDIMHARTEYDEHQAASILNHVKGFMQRVAEGPDKTARQATASVTLAAVAAPKVMSLPQATPSGGQS